MKEEDFRRLAIDQVKKYATGMYDTSKFDVYVVWESKTLQNNKALLSTDIPDGRYYEVTYNGDNLEMYVDVYKKEYNKSVDILE